mgnify:CR=1 FL=1
MRNPIFLLALVNLIFFSKIQGQAPTGNREIVKLENPITVQYIKSKLKKSTPRLILTPAIEKNLKLKIKTDPVVKNFYEALQLNAADILTQPVLTRKLIGRRLLGTSREMLSRLPVL